MIFKGDEKNKVIKSFGAYISHLHTVSQVILYTVCTC